MEKSWNFVGQPQWEPCSVCLSLSLSFSVCLLISLDLSLSRSLEICLFANSLEFRLADVVSGLSECLSALELTAHCQLCLACSRAR